MFDWITEDFAKNILLRGVAALIALGVAHTQTLQSWGVTLDWSKLQGKIDTAVVLLVGLAIHHHVDKAVKGVANG
jgi:hypothetical protein